MADPNSTGTPHIEHFHHSRKRSYLSNGVLNYSIPFQLTTKILFDSKTNFKSITLGLSLTEGSVVASSASIQPVLIDWLQVTKFKNLNFPPKNYLTIFHFFQDYFTVVEYPVLGYVPPAILTEMHFDLKHCTFDVTYLTPGKVIQKFEFSSKNSQLKYLFFRTNFTLLRTSKGYLLSSWSR